MEEGNVGNEERIRNEGKEEWGEVGGREESSWKSGREVEARGEVPNAPSCGEKKREVWWREATRLCNKTIIQMEVHQASVMEEGWAQTFYESGG